MLPWHLLSDCKCSMLFQGVLNSQKGNGSSPLFSLHPCIQPTQLNTFTPCLMPCSSILLLTWQCSGRCLWVCALNCVIAPLVLQIGHGSRLWTIRQKGCFCLTICLSIGISRYWPGKHCLLQGWHALLCDDCQKTEPAGKGSHSACEWLKTR